MSSLTLAIHRHLCLLGRARSRDSDNSSERRGWTTILCIFLLLNHHAYPTNLKLNRQVTWVSVCFFVLIFVEALHGPPFFIVGVRDCRYVSAKLPPSLMVIQELFTRASTNRFVVLAVAVGLVRVNNCPE